MSEISYILLQVKYMQRLRDICATQESSKFFQSHEVYSLKIKSLLAQLV